MTQSMWLRYDQDKRKVCFPKKFEIVTTLQQNVSNRGSDDNGGGCDGCYNSGGDDAGGDGGGGVGGGYGVRGSDVAGGDDGCGDGGGGDGGSGNGGFGGGVGD